MLIGPNIRAVLVLCSICRVVELSHNSDVTNLIRSFIDEKKWSAAMFFTCWRAAGKEFNYRLFRIGQLHKRQECGECYDGIVDVRGYVS
jgi:hypothetical protein